MCLTEITGNTMESHQESFLEPIWSKFKLKFYANNKRQQLLVMKKVKEFEKNHPELTLIHSEHGLKNIQVGGENILFSNGKERYQELKYSYDRHYFTFYYQPSEELYKALVSLQKLNDRIARIRNKSS